LFIDLSKYVQFHLDTPAQLGRQNDEFGLLGYGKFHGNVRDIFDNYS
jgi:hypothetical protein